MSKNERNVDVFLNRLNWKINSGEMKEITEFQVDVYCFRFKNGLDDDTAKEFTRYLKRLKMDEVRSVMKIFVWLYQHKVDFRLVFRWNPRLPVEYNLKSLFNPKQVREQLLANGHDDLMSYPVESMDKED